MEDLKRQWKNASVNAHRSGTKLFFNPQKKVSEDILRLFTTKVLVTLCAPPQWGKTGVSLLTAFRMCSERKIDPGSVFFITAMSDRSWIDQTRERVLPIWEENVFHRNTLEKFKGKVKRQGSRNILIIVDECHMANSIHHTLGRIFEELEIKDPEEMIKNNIKILQISATPSNSLIDGDEWEDYHGRVTPMIDEGYVSFQRFIDDERIHEPFSLEFLDETETYIDENTIGKEPMYHFVRSVSSGVSGAEKYVHIQVNFEILRDEKEIEFIELNMGMEKKEIRKLYRGLSKKPERHTFILIKNMLGASKTIDDTYIGSVHESFPMKKDYNSEVQGLPGRLCGWTKRRGKDGPNVYCDRFILEKYIDLYNSNFAYAGEDFVWNGSRLKVNLSGKISSKTSFISLDLG
jgi:hypothetical protein